MVPHTAPVSSHGSCPSELGNSDSDDPDSDSSSSILERFIKPEWVKHVLVLKGMFLNCQSIWYEFVFMVCVLTAAKCNKLQTALHDSSGSSSEVKSLAFNWSKASK